MVNWVQAVHNLARLSRLPLATQREWVARTKGLRTLSEAAEAARGLPIGERHALEIADDLSRLADLVGPDRPVSWHLIRRGAYWGGRPSSSPVKIEPPRWSPVGMVAIPPSASIQTLSSHSFGSPGVIGSPFFNLPHS